MSMRDESARVWVGGLPDSIRENEIEREFSRFGHISEVMIRVNRGHPCFAFVQYSDRRDAEDAVRKMDQSPLFGQRFIKVSWAGNPRGNRSEPVRRDRSPPRDRRSRSPRRERSPPRRSRSPPRDEQRGRSGSRPREGERGGDFEQRDRDRGGERHEERRRSPPREEYGGDRDRREYGEERRRSPPRDERDRYDRRSPPRDARRHDRSPRRDEGRRQGSYRVVLENLPVDMTWQKLKELGQDLVRRGNCTFARTRRDATGVLEFTTEDDMHTVIRELDGARLHGADKRLVVFEERGR